MKENEMLEEIVRHLDSETSQGVVRMSVEIDEKSGEEKRLDHKCCHMYGRAASETVALLDMYTDISQKE